MRVKKTTRITLIGVLCTIVAAAIAAFSLGLVDYVRFEQRMNAKYDEEALADGPWPRQHESCFSCHGPKGQSKNEQYPSLAGQPQQYLLNQLTAFRNGSRASPFMAPIARSLPEKDLVALAAYFSKQAAPPADTTASKPGHDTPSLQTCVACHGTHLEGKDHFPMLAGQGEAYLKEQLIAFKQGKRNDPTGAMNAVANTLSDADISSMAHRLALDAVPE